MFTVFLSGAIYPMVVSWAWTEGGFLKHGSEAIPWLKFHDFGGSVVVHAVGGVAGLIFAHAVGPRLGLFINHSPQLADGKIFYGHRIFCWLFGRKDKNIFRPELGSKVADKRLMEGHDSSLVAAGTFILWFGWYGFNAGSTGQLSDGGVELAGRAISTTSMSAAGGVLMAVILNSLGVIYFTPQSLCNALLSGLVSITASCSIVELWSALVIGAVGTLFSIGADKVMKDMYIDDPLQAFAIHGASGIWGGLAVGIFGADWSSNPAGGQQFASQVIGISVIVVWTASTTVFALTIVDLSLRIANVGGLRVPASEELEGLDTIFSNNAVGDKKTRGVTAPEGVITIVYTDIQGSTILWEEDPQAMSACMALHDHVLRSELVRYGGYEITTEGDAFMLAFTSPVNAVNFCMQVQSSLLESEWPRSILNYPECCEVYAMDSYEDDEYPGNQDSKRGNSFIGPIMLSQNPTAVTDARTLIYRGLRVRMAIDIGHCQRQLHPTTRTFRYQGSPIVYAKQLVSVLPSGGIVAITHRVQSELAGQMSLMEGSSMCHLGFHVLSRKIRPKISIFSLLPSKLEARVLMMGPLNVEMEVGPGYLSAPGVTQIALDSNLTACKHKTLKIHHSDPGSREVAIAFASLILVEEMSSNAGSRGDKSKAAPDDANTDEDGSSRGGSMRHGMAYMQVKARQLRSSASYAISPRVGRVSTPTRLDRVHSNSDDGESDGSFKISQRSDTSTKFRDEDTSVSVKRRSRVSAGFNFPTSPYPRLAKLRLEAQKLAGPLIRKSLEMTNGYECQEDDGIYMVAFASALDAVRWGAILSRIVDSFFADRFSVAVGVHWGLPTSISPHASSGRADYFGTVVNTAARVHSFAASRLPNSMTIASHAIFAQLTDEKKRDASFDDASNDEGSVRGRRDAKVPAREENVKEPENDQLHDDSPAGPRNLSGRKHRLSSSFSTHSMPETTAQKCTSPGKEDAYSTLEGSTADEPFENSTSFKSSSLDREAEGLPPIECSIAEEHSVGGLVFKSFGEKKLKGIYKPMKMLGVSLPEELSDDILQLEESLQSFLEGREDATEFENDSDLDGSLLFIDPDY